MKPYSEKQINLLHQEFKSIKRYIDKLSFYDLHFGVIPFAFPGFDPELSLFFQVEKMNVLADIIKQERNNPGLTEKSFSFKTTYRFNIKPTNSNSSIYSNYILSKFVSLAPDLNAFLRPANQTDRKYFVGLLDKANQLINNIEYKLLNGYDKSLRQHCMTVFYKGVFDGFTGGVILPDKKRKFTELYLYAQGIVYARFLALLRNHVGQKKTEGPKPTAQAIADQNQSLERINKC